VALARTPYRKARRRRGRRAVRELLDGAGASAALECVGTQQSLEQAIESTRFGGRIGCVGLPHGIDSLDFRRIFGFNRRVGGGAAQARTYLPGLIADVLSDRIRPGRVFDMYADLADVAEAYKEMDERRSIKPMLKP
jgi:threonine dehydrogenase-like Zn-dependent dehydrogenase